MDLEMGLGTDTGSASDATTTRRSDCPNWSPLSNRAAALAQRLGGGGLRRVARAAMSRWLTSERRAVVAAVIDMGQPAERIAR